MRYKQIQKATTDQKKKNVNKTKRKRNSRVPRLSDTLALFFKRQNECFLKFT